MVLFRARNWSTPLSSRTSFPPSDIMFPPNWTVRGSRVRRLVYGCRCRSLRVGDVERLDAPISEPGRPLPLDGNLLAAFPAAIFPVEVPPRYHETVPRDRHAAAAGAIGVLLGAPRHVADVSVVQAGLGRDLVVLHEKLVGGDGDVEHLVIRMEPRELDGGVRP